jgi:hypothetical protein
MPTYLNDIKLSNNYKGTKYYLSSTIFNHKVSFEKMCMVIVVISLVFRLFMVNLVQGNKETLGVSQEFYALQSWVKENTHPDDTFILLAHGIYASWRSYTQRALFNIRPINNLNYINPDFCPDTKSKVKLFLTEIC